LGEVPMGFHGTIFTLGLGSQNEIKVYGPNLGWYDCRRIQSEIWWACFLCFGIKGVRPNQFLCEQIGQVH